MRPIYGVAESTLKRGSERSSSTMFSGEMAVGKVEVLFPIVFCDIVFSGADVIADGVAHRMVSGRPFAHAEARFAEQFVNGFGIFAGKEFAFGVGPFILFG